MKLTPVMEKFVLHWGEMGTRWGTNRSVAQIHALLFLAAKPLPADEIADTLGIARSNVSNSLKELQGWGLVQLTHVMGDRRDHFTAPGDTWEMLMTIAEERKRREIDPTLTVLRDCVAQAEHDDGTPAEARDRISKMLGFIENMAGWYEQMRRLPRPTLVALMKLGAKVGRFIK
ncbi:MAG: GbsR/MarR family transcriptional regulator [Reyranellaceae bacterium]